LSIFLHTLVLLKAAAFSLIVVNGRSVLINLIKAAAFSLILISGRSVHLKLNKDRSGYIKINNGSQRSHYSDIGSSIHLNSNKYRSDRIYSPNIIAMVLQ
jgi:hypothetical protein